MCDRETVCVIVRVCPHTYTNCGVSYIRGTSTPFSVPQNLKTQQKINFISIIWLQVLTPIPQKKKKIPWKKKTKTEKTPWETSNTADQNRKPEQSRAGLPETASMWTLSRRLGYREEHRPDPGGTVCASDTLTAGFSFKMKGFYISLIQSLSMNHLY